jgi:ABC-type hemin transport system ATPase subunit
MTTDRYEEQHAAALAHLPNRDYATRRMNDQNRVAVAQVHATLALAAAVAPAVTLREYTEPIDLFPTEGRAPGQVLRDAAQAPSPVLAVLNDVVAEYARAKAKHGEMTLDGPAASDVLRLAALVEEVGEVGTALSYDRGSTANLYAELVQVANVAITWAAHLLPEDVDEP